MYYNTTNESGEQLGIFHEKAKTQDILILEFFQDQPAVEYGASQVLRAVFSDRVPLTSVRRSISNLVAENKLEYSGRMRKGNYNRNEKLIRLKLS